ncbi:type VI secretion system-associated protein TagF [Massilia horti]|uniref:Type VI secretion system-associated protein TagF n=2 Tax=Massilia horti TaxID=2562153 RepID=A0A4Y9T3B6_9BURK|nr:type VI secretion system-associated protein TagF [Massilia horti]
MERQAPGFYGKLASHGDFIWRRLAPGFIGVWDGWLQACIQASRVQLGENWLDVYLTGPIWRFALAPGVCDGQAWAGVLMPSVDRVGRHFPLMIAAGADQAVPLAQWLGANWFEQVEDLALSTLDVAFSFEQFDAALLSLPGLPLSPAPGTNGPLGWQIGIESANEAAGVADAVACAALYGQSVWWTDGSERVEPCVRLCRGLPAPQAYGAMLKD